MRDILVAIMIFLIVLGFCVIGHGLDKHEREISALTRSHAVMEYRQKILTEITCGYCHSRVPDWCDKHDGVK